MSCVNTVAPLGGAGGREPAVGARRRAGLVFGHPEYPAPSHSSAAAFFAAIAKALAIAYGPRRGPSLITPSGGFARLSLPSGGRCAQPRNKAALRASTHAVDDSQAFQLRRWQAAKRFFFFG